jgi:hypothetical protein
MGVDEAAKDRASERSFWCWRQMCSRIKQEHL